MINSILEDINNNEESPFGNFEIVCKKCGSKNIDLENSLGFSELSGCWGSIDLMCMDCENRQEIYNP